MWILFTNCFTEECDGGISMIKTDGSAMQHVTPNSHDSYNLADMGPDGRLAYMRWHVAGVKMARAGSQVWPESVVRENKVGPVSPLLKSRRSHT